MKIASIGTGFITDWVMGQMLEYAENEYVAIYSRKVETAQKLQEKYHVKKVYTDLDEMLADDEIDCIYVASPNSMHAKHAIQAMKAGKNVICEKPFASNVKECEEMIRVSKETNKFLFEAITVMYNPNYLEIKNQLPKIGQVRIVECNMSQYSSKYDAYLANKNPNVFTSEFSGGALMDLNVYNIHYVVGLFGMPQEVNYFATLTPTGVDLGGTLVMKYDGFVASLIASKNSIGKTFTQIQGENGYIYSDLASSLSKNLKVQIRKGEYYEMDLQQRENTHYFYAGEMLKMVQENNRERCDQMLEHSLNVMRVIDMAKKSAGIVFKADK
ncbi:MAG: Gfo/Idh/MocA family protein [Traorella sp.]